MGLMRANDVEPFTPTLVSESEAANLNGHSPSSGQGPNSAVRAMILGLRGATPLPGVASSHLRGCHDSAPRSADVADDCGRSRQGGGK